MAEANPNIPQIPTIHITTAAHVLAQFRARQAVKQQLQRRGVKVSHLAANEWAGCVSIHNLRSFTEFADGERSAMSDPLGRPRRFPIPRHPTAPGSLT